MKNKILKTLENLEKERAKNRRIEKVSLEVFEKAVNKLTENKFTKEEIKKLYEDLPNPKRGSESSAGYDFYAPYDFSIEPNEVKIVPTGFKVSMNSDEVFNMYVRSSTGFKYNVRLCNQVGIIDADYYNNPDNEGHIMIAFHNHGTKTWENFSENKVKEDKSRIAQGLFTKYFVTENDDASTKKRVGGIGSTNNN